MAKKKSYITYEKAGVGIERGDDFAETVGKMAKKTGRKEVVSGIGGFAALFAIDKTRYPDPLICASTDGVGTKLRIAFAADMHETVGIDLVAMSVNDLICAGAEPLFFLDYFATGKLEPETAKKVMKGIVEGCRQANCSLIGGETAEMPDMYPKGEYDLAGFAVGAVNRGDELPKRGIKPGDALIGVSSSGFHSNGYSLVRKVVFKKRKLKADDIWPGTKKSVAEVLLQPTLIYVNLFMNWRKRLELLALAHITGGGIAGNLERVLPEGVAAVIDRNSWDIPQPFKVLAEMGPISEEEMFNTFNMGLGLIAVVPEKDAGIALKTAKRAGFSAQRVGIIAKSKGAPVVNII